MVRKYPTSEIEVSVGIHKQERWSLPKNSFMHFSLGSALLDLPLVGRSMITGCVYLGRERSMITLLYLNDVERKQKSDLSSESCRDGYLVKLITIWRPIEGLKATGVFRYFVNPGIELSLESPGVLTSLI